MTLFFLTVFLILPYISRASSFDGVDLAQVNKYIELSQDDSRQLINTLRQVLTVESD
jgi:hypothetical protein